MLAASPLYADNRTLADRLTAAAERGSRGVESPDANRNHNTNIRESPAPQPAPFGRAGKCPSPLLFIREMKMILRNTVLLGALAAFLSGCIVVSHPGQPRRHDSQHDNKARDTQVATSHEGYFYTRVIFINNVPCYVYDDRSVRPIPPHLHNHFRKYSYGTIREPLVFSGDAEVRDGYAMSRIVYLNGIPHHVTDDRVARPLPGHLHRRFGQAPTNQASAPGNGVQPPVMQRNEAPAHGRERNEPPAYGQGRGFINVPADIRDRSRFGQASLGREQGDNRTPPQPPIARDDNRPAQPPANGLEKEQNVPPARGWNQERMVRPPHERQQQQRNDPIHAGSPGNMMPPAAGNDPRRMPPVQHQQANLRQDPRNAERARAGTPAGDVRARNDGRAQASNDTSKKGSDKKEAREGEDDDSSKEDADKKTHPGKGSNRSGDDDAKGKKRE